MKYFLTFGYLYFPLKIALQPDVSSALSYTQKPLDEGVIFVL
jgi:hypothetical protein